MVWFGMTYGVVRDDVVKLLTFRTVPRPGSSANDPGLLESRIGNDIKTMDTLLLQLLLTGLGGAASPVAIAALINVLTHKSAVKNGLFFLLGFTLTLLTIGAAALLVFQSGYRLPQIPVLIRDYVDIGLGIACFILLLIVRERSAKKKPDTDTSDHVKPLTSRKAFTLGVIFMTTNYSTVIIYASGIHLIILANIDIASGLLMLSFLTLITLLTIIIPITAYALVPGKAEALLSSLAAWLNKHNKMISQAVLAFFGVYLAIRGFTELLS